ncbi:hypothetical protein WN943_025350 [Citrus x changshan-huyou]
MLSSHQRTFHINTDMGVEKGIRLGGLNHARMSKAFEYLSSRGSPYLLMLLPF